MSFTGREDHSITLTTAAEWTRNYRTANPSATKGHFYGKNAIEAILAQEGCVGIRIYYAIDNTGAKQLVLVGATTAENDLYYGVLAERGAPCPTRCGANNPLNTTT